MPNRLYPFALTRKRLRAMAGGGPGSIRFEFLDFFAVRDTALQVYDFTIKALDTTNDWTVGAGTTATTWAVRAEPGGWIRGVTGTTAATSGLQLSIPTKYWNGDTGCGMAILYRLSAVTEIRLEAGFVDALPAVNTTIVNSLTTPTFNTATDAALWVFDHTGTTTTSGLYTAGTGMTAARTATTTHQPAAATVHFAVVQVLGNRAYLYTGDSQRPVAAHSSGVTDYVEGGNGLIPVVSVKGSNTTSKNVDIDTIILWSGRLG